MPLTLTVAVPVTEPLMLARLPLRFSVALPSATLPVNWPVRLMPLVTVLVLSTEIAVAAVIVPPTEIDPTVLLAATSMPIDCPIIEKPGSPEPMLLPVAVITPSLRMESITAPPSTRMPVAEPPDDEAAIVPVLTMPLVTAPPLTLMP
ncbi:hypothetical protein LMG26411_07945 [Cupriavidus numazuensis]|uniref:Uncharacterized protein n=1 Tax=Cupriavidus numazuensis TaxID=221992 RepID=A0ABN7QDV5_9BURK|nr:hypothetical protein LMG26411_07945 [Cupriavidus numazuensis]